ncbi:MAG: metallophosphoesterase family protein [Oscillospiraceae bacterium]|nr:metallophosphoesterase family protein [Oscillospiraceae bacterium]
MANFFTADLHFGHEAIIGFCDRPFENITKMNKVLIDNWNSRIRNDDHVYIVGDLYYGGRDGAGVDEAIKIVKELNGILHLVAGNHDFPYLKNMEYHYLFADVDQIRYLKHGEDSIFLCHYPMAEWSGYFRGSWHIYGHIHNAKNTAYDYMRNQERALNAGVDICDFMPVTFDELKMYNERSKQSQMV